MDAGRRSPLHDRWFGQKPNRRADGSGTTTSLASLHEVRTARAETETDGLRQAYPSATAVRAVLRSPKRSTAACRGFYALGDLQFDFGEWMQGSTTVAIDPAGDYVAGFEWTPTAKIPVASPPLLPLGPKGTTTGPIEAFEIPLHPGAIIAGGTAYVDVELRAFASLGPGSIHDIYLQGLLSSSPYFFNTLALGAQLDVPGRAELRVLGVDGGKSSGTTEYNGEAINYHRMTQLYSVEELNERRLLVAVVYLFRAHPNYALTEKKK